eukprot:1144816-Pelagomonas_calceolata.AAC.1
MQGIMGKAMNKDKKAKASVHATAAYSHAAPPTLQRLNPQAQSTSNKQHGNCTHPPSLASISNSPDLCSARNTPPLPSGALATVQGVSRMSSPAHKKGPFAVNQGPAAVTTKCFSDDAWPFCCESGTHFTFFHQALWQWYRAYQG